MKHDTSLGLSVGPSGKPLNILSWFVGACLLALAIGYAFNMGSEPIPAPVITVDCPHGSDTPLIADPDKEDAFFDRLLNKDKN